jgi:NADH-quinone oxidoreductase subunit N
VSDTGSYLIETAQGLFPELILMAVAAFLALWGSSASVISPEARRSTQRWSAVVGAAALVVALVVHFLWSSDAAVEPLRMAFLNDSLAQVIRPVGLLAGLILLVFAWEQIHPRFAAEQIACLLLIVAGTNLVGASNDLIALFVALELVSIPTYILLFLSRNDTLALEATAKYFLLSIFSSAFVLYGLSILLGSAGSTNFMWLKHSLQEPTGMVTVGLLQIAVAMTVAGLGFRITAVPFHFYAPDVFQGTSTAMAGLLAVLPKIVGFLALLRLVWCILLTGEVHPDLVALAAPASGLLALLAFLTMTVGNVLALLQTDLRRLLAYSSVAHAGYMLVGLAVLPGASAQFSGMQVVVFYLLIYVTMTLGVFGTILLLRKGGQPIEKINDLDGIATQSPWLGLVLALFLFSLTGLPPTGGFWGKLNLFLAAWSTGLSDMRLLALALAINAAISGYYYLRLIGRAYLQPYPETGANLAEKPLLLALAVGACAVVILGLFFSPGSLWQLVAVVTP